jgi:hypothetical protein
MKPTTLIIISITILFLASCKISEVQSPPNVYAYYNDTIGTGISIEFTKGCAFNSPLLAIWVEDEMGNFLQTLYVAKSIGKGIFEHADASTGKWVPGPIMRPAALPYWSHRRGIKNSSGLYLPDAENPIADAYTGPTPPGNFILNTRIENSSLRKFSVYLEINQPWDWNEFWTNGKFPADEEYKTSCQPALVYMTDVNLDSEQKTYQMAVIGHSHYSGKTGELFTDISTMTTALNIVKSIRVIVR